MMITKLSQLDFTRKYTYVDYLTWNLMERVELIKGYVFRMCPAPSSLHQKISVFLTSHIFQYLRGKRCNVYSAPFDVRFYSISETGEKVQDSVVQPDICVICDPAKIDARGCLGAPDLIVEILSPSTSEKDLNHKYELYRTNGVREYWIVSPENKSIVIHTLQEDGGYISSRPYTRGHVVNSAILEDISLDLTEVFEPFDWKALEEEELKYTRV